MKRRHLIIMLITGGLFLLALGFAASTIAPSADIVDLSWPNCSINQNISFQLGIVGINGGLDFKPNPCLIKESSVLQKYNVYINTGYPGIARGRKYQHFPLRCSYKDAQCLAYNYGYNASLYAVRYADLSNVHSPFWWLDIETDNSWTNSTKINRSSINGAADAVVIQNPFANIGIYSSLDQWNILTDKWSNQFPIWIATGSYARESAVSACKLKSFTGGPKYLAQYTNILDINHVCSNKFYSDPLYYSFY